MSQWSDAKLRMVRAIWGLAVGTVLVVAAVFFVPDVLAEGLTRDELLLLGLFVVVGFLAASPSTAFQAIGKAFEAWEKRRSGGGS